MAQRYRLKLSRLDFVSPVDTPAQETATVVLLKRGAAEELDGKARVVKMDDSLGLVFCWAFTSSVDNAPYFDLQGDAIDEDFVKAAAEFMENGGATDEMHDGNPDGRVLFAMPMTPEIAKAFGVVTKTTGLMVALKPSPEVYAKFKSGEYTGVSIAGLGERQAIKAATKSLADLGDEVVSQLEALIESAKAEKAVRSANPDHFDETGDSWRYRVRPESQFTAGTFRTIALGKDTGVKAVVGKFPGKDVEHIQTLIFDKKTFKTKASAAAWIHKNPDVLRQPHEKRADVAKVIRKLPDGQYGLYTSDGKKLLSKHPSKADAQKQENAIHAHENDMGKRFSKLAILTSEEAGHQHAIDLDDPACEYRDFYMTTLNNAEGAEEPHAHAWTFDPATGAVTVGADSGHTHTVPASVPADVLAAFRSDRADAVVENLVGDEDSDGIPVPVDREESSGATVVVVTARANSTREPATKQAGPVSKENTQMQIVVLTEAQKAHHDKLSPSDQATFLAKSATERDAEVAKAIEADPVVFKGTRTGVEVRKSHGELARKLAEQNETNAEALAKQAESIAKRDEIIEKAEIAKQAVDLFGGLAGDDETHQLFVRALRKSGADAVALDKAYTAAKAWKALAKAAGTPNGTTEEAADSPQSAFDAGVTKFAKDHGMKNVLDAYEPFLKTDEGKALKRALDAAHPVNAHMGH